MSAYQLPELPGVVWVDQMAQLMDHHIIGDGMGCLDDVPVENQLPLFIAGSPTRLEVAHAHPCWRHADLLGITVCFLLQALLSSGAIPVMKALQDPYLPLLTLLDGADGDLDVSRPEANPHLVPLLNL